MIVRGCFETSVFMSKFSFVGTTSYIDSNALTSREMSQFFFQAGKSMYNCCNICIAFLMYASKKVNNLKEATVILLRHPIKLLNMKDCSILP